MASSSSRTSSAPGRSTRSSTTSRTSSSGRAGRSGLELATGLANRGKNVTVIDDEPWLQAEFADPDVMKIGQDSLEHMGVKFMFTTELKELKGKDGKLVAAVTDKGEIPCQMAFMAADEKPNTALAESIGVQARQRPRPHRRRHDADERARRVRRGRRGGDDAGGRRACRRRSCPRTYAYPQGRVAGINAAGGAMHTRAAYFPWALEVGHVQIGGVLITETLAKALGSRTSSARRRGSPAPATTRTSSR